MQGSDWQLPVRLCGRVQGNDQCCVLIILRIHITYSRKVNSLKYIYVTLFWGYHFYHNILYRNYWQGFYFLWCSQVVKLLGFEPVSLHYGHRD